MAVALVMDFPGGTKDDYDTVVAKMELGGRVPSRGLFPAGGPTGDGWRVIDVWESMDVFQRFAEQRIMPLTAAQGMAPPNVGHVDVHTLWRSDQSGSPALVQVVRVDGADASVYESVNARVLPAPGQLPEGCLFHVAGPVDGGWCIIDAWTSREARDRLIDQVGPALAEAGFGPPQIEDLDVHATLAAGAAAPA